MKVAVVADSTAYIPEHIKEKNEIYTIPLVVNMKDQSYLEGTEITNETFFLKMSEMAELPSTSQPSIGDYILLLENLRDQGYTDVISVHLSSEISGTCANARAAGESVDGINLHIIDSEIACMIQGFMAIFAAQQKDKMPLEKLLDELNEMKKKENTNALFIVDTLTNLQKGGRLSNAQAMLGGLLKVKPILEFQDGKIVPFEKIRTIKKAMKKAEEEFQKQIENHKGKKITAVVIHSNAEEAGESWMKELQERHPEVDFHLSYFGPVIATHLGEGALGLGYTTYDIDM